MARRQVTIALRNFWAPNLRMEGLFGGLPYLFDHFEFVPASDPEFVLFGDIGTPDTAGRFTKIFYTAENVRPDMRLYDWAFSFDYDEELRHPRHLRLPNYVRNGAGRDLIKPTGQAADILSGKTRFCNFIFHNDAEPRNGFFDRLSAYRHVDAPGRCRNNMAPIGDFATPTESRHASGYQRAKIPFMSPYKFSIAFENASYPGYTTEKLYHAMLAGTLPIDWGNPLVARDFNPRSFVNAADYPSLDAVIDRVKAIDHDDELYRRYMREPWYHGNRLSPYVDPDRILERFVAIFGS